MSVTDIAIMPTDSKLKKLLLRLSSDQPGEIVAAATAIGRHLKHADLDWHDLANRLTEPAPPIVPDVPAGWRSTAYRCLHRPDILRSPDRQFLHCVLRQGALSAAQMKWLGDIAERVGVQQQ